MTPADLARYSAISFECKKDSLRQTQAGTWKIAFTVQGLDMDERLTKAFPGTRYMAVLVEVDDLEMPVSPAAKEKIATPQPAPDRPSAGAKRDPEQHTVGSGLSKLRMDWRELQPAAQCGIRCSDPVFRKFLWEVHSFDSNSQELWAAKFVRKFCGVESRAELGTKHAARMLWKQLDDQFLAWKMKERVGA